jgi:hypothetical protein
LIYNRIICTRIGKNICFFKLEEVECGPDETEERWVHYYEIEHDGFISYTDGNVRM